jgi:cold shock CspA family protein
MTARTGTLKTFLPERGFGFIIPHDGKDAGGVFFHVSSAALIDEADLVPGLMVLFEDGTGPNGRRCAVRVERDPEADPVTRIN